MMPTETIDALNAEAWERRFTDPEGAVELAAEAERLSREGSGYPHGLGQSLLTAGICALNRSEHERAAGYLAAALDLLAGCGEREGEANALNGLGWLYTARGEYPRAVEHHHASLTISRQIDDRNVEIQALNGIGNVHNSVAEYPQALEHYQASLGISREIGNPLGEANALCNIGLVYMSLGEYPRALEHYQASLGIFRGIDNRSGEANALTNIGVIHDSLGEHPQALEYYHASLGIFQEIGNRSGEATVLSNICNVHSALEEYPQALEHAQASLAISREIGDRGGEAAALVGIAFAHTILGEFPVALAELEGAAGIARQIGDRSGLGEAMTGLGETYAAMEQPEASIVPLEESITLALELGSRRIEIRARNLIWQQYRIVGNLSAALENLLRYSELKEELLGEETRRSVQNRETSLQIEIARKEAEIERLRNVELKAAFDKLDQAHTDLKAAQSSLVQSEKMASLGQLTAGLAHEINNPINFVSASVVPLRRDHAVVRQALTVAFNELPAERAAQIDSEFDLEETFTEIDNLLVGIGDGASRTAQIIAGLRSFSRLDEGGLKRVDLHEGLNATLTILSGSLSEGIALVREYGDLPEVECYPGEINQVFMNILTNAIKAIEGSGRVTIGTKASGDSVSIVIADTGCGMTPDVQQRIFEPFFTTRDVGQGKGLGLSIAWGIVEKHGGTIEVTSTPGSGSTFAVTLPIRQEQS
jgi:two-component system, NtrC family, sensor kinase